MKEKSQENWDAAELCRTNAKMNAATSRFYYSIFLAARYWADKAGVFLMKYDAKDIHETMARVVGTHAGEKAMDCRCLMNDLKGLRVTADYKPEPITNDAYFVRVIEKAKDVRTFFLS